MIGSKLRPFFCLGIRTKIKTKVRYRLLFLTSMPVFITMVALVLISIYWATQYTWQNALADVSERLKIAENHMHQLQKIQEDSVRYIGNSYEFRTRLLSGNYTEKELNIWLSTQSSTKFLDEEKLSSVRWRDVNTDLTINYSRTPSFYQVLNKNELLSWSASLMAQAAVPMNDSNSEEVRALVNRTIYPVYDENGLLLGFIDGILLLNNNRQIVDDIRALIYPDLDIPTTTFGAVTIFLDDLRVSTNVPMDSFNPNLRDRALGTKVSGDVRQKVLESGEYYLDSAYVHNNWYISAYEPLYDLQNNVIGMLYVGHQLWPLIEAYIINLGEIALMVCSVLLISGYIIHLGTKDLFHPIEKISSVVNAIQKGEDKRIGNLNLAEKHELAELAKHFDQMLDQLAYRNQLIQQAAEELEGKVKKRTASLHEKTEQLEHHINLLNQTRDKLIVSEKLAALGQLTTGIAHEINNPVAVILGNTELIKMELGDDASLVTEELETIFNQINRIRNITQSLLQYSRGGGGKDSIAMQGINNIVSESITLVKTGSKQKEVRFSTDFQAIELVECNRNHLLQILINLQMNAIQAMNGRGILQIKTENWFDKGEVIGVIIHVQDEGPGIEPEYLSKVFDPFYTTKTDGTGLGLSVSQGLIHRIGGEIRAESDYDKGACFSLYLNKYAKYNLPAAPHDGA